jgi:hypothetical protein
MQNGYLKLTNISTSSRDPITGMRAIVQTIMRGRGDPGYMLTSGTIKRAWYQRNDI